MFKYTKKRIDLSKRIDIAFIFFTDCFSLNNLIAELQTKKSTMEKWIEILKAGDYPQGNVTVQDLQLMAQYYDPNFQQAPFIPEHRKFNEKGELINNLNALAWIKAVRVKGDTLQVLPEDEEFLKLYYDGKSYRYASAEIEMAEIEGKKVPYLAAVAVTNFPASKIKKIKLNGKEDIKVYTLKIKNEELVMNKEQFIQLCKVLGLKEDATPEQAITKLTEMTDKLKEKDEFAETANALKEAIKLIKLDNNGNGNEGGNEDIKQLTEVVNKLVTRLDQVDEQKAIDVFEQAVRDKKVMPSQKEDLVGTADKPGTFYKNADGLRAFVEKLPVLQLNKQITIPKDPQGKPLTYAQVVKDPVLYQKLKEENPELLKELKEKRFEEAAATEE